MGGKMAGTSTANYKKYSDFLSDFASVSVVIIISCCSCKLQAHSAAKSSAAVRYANAIITFTFDNVGLTLVCCGQCAH